MIMKPRSGPWGIYLPRHAAAAQWVPRVMKMSSTVESFFFLSCTFFSHPSSWFDLTALTDTHLVHCD